MRGSMGDEQRLKHILSAIIEIEKYLHNRSYDDFIADSMARFATIKQLEIIGEACNLVSEKTQKEFPEIEWKKIIGLRHILVHEYFGVDNQLIWQIVQQDLPGLKQKIEGILSSL